MRFDTIESSGHKLCSTGSSVDLQNLLKSFWQSNVDTCGRLRVVRRDGFGAALRESSADHAFS